MNRRRSVFSSPLLHNCPVLAGAWAGSVIAALWIGKSFLGATPRAETQPASGLSSSTVLAPRPSVGPGSLTPGASAAATASLDQTARDPAADQRPIADRLKALADMENPIERMAGFLKLLDGLKTNEDMQAALEGMMDGFEPRGRGREFSMLMYQWGQRDPDAALASMKKLDDWRGRMGAYTVLSNWAQRNPEAAIAWAKQNGPTDPKNEDGNWFMLGAITGLVKTDPERAAMLALEQPKSRARGEMMDRLLDAYGKKGATGAQDWVNTLPEGAFREGVTRRLASRIADKDPSSSVAFLEQQPAAPWKGEAFAEAVDRWADKDPNAAGTWLGKYPPSPETDDPRRAFALKIKDKDPESAMAWAGTVSNDKARTRLMMELARDWYKREPQAAQSFIDRNNWPEEFRRKVLN